MTPNSSQAINSARESKQIRPPVTSALGSAVEAFIGPVNNPAGENMRSLKLLFRLLNLMERGSSSQNSPFMKILTARQLQVALLLEEWWTKKYDEATMSRVKQILFGHALVEQCATTGQIQSTESYKKESQKLEPLMNIADCHLLAAVVRDLEQGRKPIREYLSEPRKLAETGSELPFGVINQMSKYHSMMYLLFNLELSTLCAPYAIDTVPHDLDEVLDNASQLAAAERISQPCLQQLMLAIDGEGNNSGHGGFKTHQHVIKDFSHNIPTQYEPCQWIQEESCAGEITKAIDYMPRYLWDIEDERTVQTADLEDPMPSYAIVSHTWGRWREEGRGAMLPGVKWWRVPENSRFKVSDLPKMLKEAGFVEKYVWLDLLCIPQDLSSESLASICQLEIARQAEIFKHATTAVAWLYDISDWHYAELNIIWFSIYFIWSTTDSTHGAERLKSLETQIQVFDSIEKPAFARSGFEGVEDGEDAAWFSSTWTLQESMMRPDMLLLNKDWRPLLAGEKVPVTLAGLAALISAMEIPQEDRPPGPFALGDFMEETGILEFSGATRVTPFMLGRSRQCTSSRAVAIMSVMGATEWHRGRTVKQFQIETTEDNKGDLVCDLYPQEFVNEVCQKAGAVFYLQIFPIPTLTTAWDESQGTRVVKTILRGTMLPFMPFPEGRTRESAGNGYNLGLPYTDHPSVRTWKIQGDGSVMIPQAVVIASSTMVVNLTDQLPMRKAMISGNNAKYSESSFTITVETDLRTWVCTFPGESHAICLAYSRVLIVGIILHRVQKGQGPFVKAARFMSDSEAGLSDFQLPSPQTVNWHVL